MKRMNKTFKDDPVFQGGLLLKDANDGAGKSRPFTQWRCISLPAQRFAETLQKATCNEYPFIEAEENQNKSVYYPFADVITAEILVGFASGQSLRFSPGECHDKDPRTNLTVYK
jgi:hypothetical protein